jgi:hypothetical protein
MTTQKDILECGWKEVENNQGGMGKQYSLKHFNERYGEDIDFLYTTLEDGCLSTTRWMDIAILYSPVTLKIKKNLK